MTRTVMMLAVLSATPAQALAQPPTPLRPATTYGFWKGDWKLFENAKYCILRLTRRDQTISYGRVRGGDRAFISVRAATLLPYFGALDSRIKMTIDGQNIPLLRADIMRSGGMATISGDFAYGDPPGLIRGGDNGSHISFAVDGKIVWEGPINPGNGAMDGQAECTKTEYYPLDE